MREKKNKIFKKALVFASVFIILLVSCSTIIFAQAPNFSEIDYFPHTGRSVRNYYFSDNTDLVCILTASYSSGNNLISYDSASIVFTDYYYNTYYTKNATDDLLRLYNNIYGKTYIVAYSESQSFAQVTVNGNFKSALNSRGITDEIFSNIGLTSYANQFEYWESEIDYLENRIVELEDDNLQFLAGYSQALEDYNIFEEGIYTIFNAPFVFVRNIVGFEIFGITLADILCGVLLLCLGFVLLKFIGGAIPL